MTRILLIRHGQSTANVKKIFAGNFNSPLSELGMLQAEQTAEYIAENYKVDKIYSSDLERALSVGKAIGDKLHIDVTAQKNLREISAGLWEGCSFEELYERFPSYRDVWLNDIGNATCDGGESVAQLQKRFVSAVTDIAEANYGKTVVITTHATSIRVMQCFCEKKTLDEMKNVPWVSNASVTELEYTGGEFSIVRVGYDAHLGECVSRLPSNV